MPRAAQRGRSRLFLSADLVGSTHYKQVEPGWQQIFLSFYREFPQFLVDADRELNADDGSSTKFELWKAIGDELIFEVEIRDEFAVSRAVRVWLSAINKYEARVLIDVKLALKGGAFIATFPGPDSESTIPRKPDTEDSAESVVLLNDSALSGNRAYAKYQFDYFGPSIDTGFRLFGMSAQRYFTLSIEVAWAMAVATHAAQADPGNGESHVVSDFVYRGSHVLKGVWRGREYPVFAIDRDCANPVNEAIANLDGEHLDPQKVIKVCDACSKDALWPFGIYLPDSTHEAFTKQPEDAMESLRGAQGSLVGVESAPGDGEGEPLGSEPPLG